MWSTGYVLDVVEGRGQFQRVLCMGNPRTKVSLSSNSSGASALLQRNVLAVNWVVLKFSTLTGLMRSVLAIFSLSYNWSFYNILICYLANLLSVAHPHSTVMWHLELSGLKLNLRMVWINLDPFLVLYCMFPNSKLKQGPMSVCTSLLPGPNPILLWLPYPRLGPELSVYHFSLCIYIYQ